MSLKLIHASDAHINYDFENGKRAFDFLLQQIQEEQPDLLLFSGDLFDSAVELHSPVVEYLIKFFIKVAKYCPINLVYGTPTHDIPGSLDLFRDLRTENPIHVSDIPQGIPIDQFYVWNFPPPMKDHYETEDQFLGRLEKIKEDFARRDNVVKIFTGHLTVRGSVLPTGQVLYGKEYEVDSETLGSLGADYYGLGHIHNWKQRWNTGYPIRYAGSMLYCNHGDIAEKGIFIVEFDPSGAAQIRRVKIPVSAKATVVGNYGEKIEVEKLIEQYQGHDLRIVVKEVPPADRDRVKEDLLKGLGDLQDHFRSVKVEIRSTSTMKPRVEMEGRNLLQKVEAWMENEGIEFTEGIRDKVGMIENEIEGE
jgi:DNA repair exonuclease SbcCD nuclease subunit